MKNRLRVTRGPQVLTHATLDERVDAEGTLCFIGRTDEGGVVAITFSGHPDGGTEDSTVKVCTSGHRFVFVATRVNATPFGTSFSGKTASGEHASVGFTIENDD